MNTLEKILSFLQSFRIVKPTNYSLFHIVSLIITIILTIVLINKKTNLKKTILVISIIMILFETYKQLSFSFDEGVWKYQWYAFPFQFCATPMYIGLIAGLTKNKKLEEMCYSYLATYGLIAGICVMLYPNTVFVEELLINIQTMEHHGLMVVMGMFTLILHSIHRNYKNVILEGFSIFIILVLIALFLDISTYYLNIDNGLEMFFISPFHVSELPIFNTIYENVPYIIFLIIYLISFFLGGTLIFYLTKLIIKRRNFNETSSRITRKKRFKSKNRST